jgi:ribose transport system substrate-binding protein
MPKRHKVKERKNMKKILIATLAVVLAIAFTACVAAPVTPQSTQATPTTAAPVTEPETKTIGFSIYDMQYEFFQDMEAGTREGVESLGYKYILHDQKSDETEMVTGARNLIDQGIDALIISPIKPDALNSIVEYAHNAGIPVVVDDIGGGGSNYDVIVVSDNYGGGVQAGEFVASKLGSTAGEVAIIKCETTAVYANRRGEGFKDTMTKAGYTVVKELVGNSKQEEGYSCMQDILVSNPNVIAVFCENDNMALGAIEAISDAGIPNGQILVFGFDATGSAREAIEAGKLAGSIAQYPAEMGKLTAELADKLIKGQSITYDNAELREIFNPVKLITADNLND